MALTWLEPVLSKSVGSEKDFLNTLEQPEAEIDTSTSLIQSAFLTLGVVKL